MLTYLQVHWYYTLPPTIILYLLYRPLMSKFEQIKIISLVALALIYTTPWDNYIIYHKAWWYRKDAVIGTIGYVPIEEYMFFIIQTIFTTMWTSCCTRWTMHSLLLRPLLPLKNAIVRYGVIVLLTSLIIWGWRNAIPATKTFYLGSIVWWSLLVVTGLWIIVGPFVVNRLKSTLVSIFVPSLYLCFIDLIALRAGVWHINEKTSLEIFFANDLPLEEIVFFFITNIVIVIGASTFDKTKSIIDTYFKEPFTGDAHATVWKRFVAYVTMLISGELRDGKMDPRVVNDIDLCSKTLVRASKSFTLASNLFPNDVKQDLTILYAFCRVTDDMIDNEIDTKQKQVQLEIMKKFLNQLFANRKVIGLYEWKIINNEDIRIDWTFFQKHLNEEQIASFRSIARIAYYLPQEPFYELVEGYLWDIDGRVVQTEDDLLEYSKYVASSVATLCTFVFCHKSCHWPDNFGPKCKLMFINARKMGQVLQVCNISRDIIIDSDELGRCYVPTTYFKSNEHKILTIDRTPNKIPNERLKLFATKMLDVADKLTNDAIHAINYLPVECQRAVLGALEIYQGIGRTIRSNPIYIRRTTASKWTKLKTILKCIYFTNIEALDKLQFTKKEL